MHYSTIVLALVTTTVSLGSTIPVDSSYSKITASDLESKITTQGGVISKAKEKGRERKAKAEVKEINKYTRLQEPGMNRKGDTVNITVHIYRILYLKTRGCVS